jgi:hypothetical protein
MMVRCSVYTVSNKPDAVMSSSSLMLVGYTRVSACRSVPYVHEDVVWKTNAMCKFYLEVILHCSIIAAAIPYVRRRQGRLVSMRQRRMRG